MNKSNLPTARPADNMSHDPLVCGLDPRADCPACRRAREDVDRAMWERLTPAWRRFWEGLRRRFPFLQRAWRSEHPPEPTPADELARFVRTLCDPQCRQPILAVMVPDLIDLTDARIDQRGGAQ